MDWTVARAFFASFFAAFGTGVNDVVNSYATIAAGILRMWHLVYLVEDHRVRRSFCLWCASLGYDGTSTILIPWLQSHARSG